MGKNQSNMDIETLKRLAARSNLQKQKMRAALNTFDQKTDPRFYENVNSGIPNLDYGTDYDPPREPNDGEVIIASRFITQIPHHLFDECRSMGYVAYYYSLPAIEFAQIISKVFKYDLFQERLGIVDIKEYWEDEMVTTSNSHILSMRIECEDSVIIISIIFPELYPAGSILIFSSDGATVSLFQDYFAELKRLALYIWQKRKDIQANANIQVNGEKSVPLDFEEIFGEFFQF